MQSERVPIHLIFPITTAGENHPIEFILVFGDYKSLPNSHATAIDIQRVDSLTVGPGY